ncbi:MAG: ABC transporter substrate-binding protein [Candidatus Bathyarchaeia archaeon]
MAVMGHDAVLGLQSGVKWINDRGGINVQGVKVPVRLIYFDDECNKDYAISLTEKLIVEDKIHFFVPPWTPEYVLATVPVCERHKIVSISVSGGADPEYQQGFKYMIQYARHGTFSFRLEIEAIRKTDPEAKTVALIASAADVGGAFREAALKYSQMNGFTVIYDVIYPEDISDAAPMLREIAALKPDVLLGATFPKSGFLIASQLKDLRINIKWVRLSMVVDKKEFAETYGKYAVGFLHNAQYDPRTKYEIFAAREGKPFVGPTNDELTEIFKTLGGTGKPHPEVGMAAPAPIIMAKFIEDARSLDPDKIVSVALASEFYTIRGLFKLDPTNPARNIGLETAGVVVQWQKKENKLVYESVYPTEFATSTLIPMPTWEEKDTWPELELEW